MNRKWLNKKLTLLIIQDASRSVTQFKLYKPIIIIIPIMILTALIILLSALSILYGVHNDNLKINNQLQLQLAEKEDEYTQSVASKNQMIDTLQNEVITLSHQAEEIKTKVEELKRLENEIRDVTEPIASKDNSVFIASYSDDLSDDEYTFDSFHVQNKFHNQSTGGTLIPVIGDDISKLASTTESNFGNLDAEMDVLLSTLSVAKKSIIEYQEHMRITPSIWPTVSTRVTSNYGYRTDPFTRRPSFHSGIDIGGQRNDPIYATADGVVVSANYDKQYGNNIVIDHTNGIRTWYMHMTKNLVQSGDTVVKGEQIGTLGTTGRSTGPHLHYEVLKDGVQVDPRPYMQEVRKDDK